MKLSEAIRQGAALRPQAFGVLVQVLADGTVCTCALGAAVEGVTGQLPRLNHCDLWRLQEKFDMTPDLVTAIINRNDKQRQTREEIAAWLEEEGL